MSSRRPGALLAVALLAATIVWIGASELAAPARAVTAILVGLLPPLLLLQAGIPEQDVRGLRAVPVYVSSMVLIWAIGILAWWAGRASGFDAAQLGLVPLPAATMLLWTGGLLSAALGLLALGRALRWQETPLVELLLPRTAAERAVFVALSLSAGVFEELAFRGFLIPALRTATGSAAMAVVVSSLAFGMLHSYQSATGTLRASGLGALLAVPMLVSGSILPSMAAHALYDVIAGVLLADWAIRRRGGGPEH